MTPTYPNIPLPPSTLELDTILSHVLSPTPTCIVQARAGSGKSSAVKRCITYLPRTTSIGYCVFNKRNQLEFLDWLKVNSITNCDCHTINGMGSRIVRKELHSHTLDKFKVRKLSQSIDPNAADWFTEDIIRFAKAYGLTTGDQLAHRFNDLLDLQGLNPPDDPIDYLAHCRKVFNACINHRDHDFDDQWHWPLLFGVVSPRYDILFIDEGQDLSIGKWNFLKQLADYLVVVGDEHQEIYGWLGAGNGMLTHIADELSCPIFPLTTSWRCSRTVISEAQRYVPDIQARPDAPEGSVTVTGHLDATPGDMILCRINSPLIIEFFRLIESNQPTCILGHDLVHSLRVVFDKAQRSRNPFLTIESYYHKKLLKCRNEKVKDMLIDQMEMAMFLYKKLSVRLEKISSIFVEQPTPGSIVLSSIHRSKGLEAETVWRIPGKFPNRAAPDWLKLQDSTNLEYVATTRAKLNYRLVEDDYQPPPITQDTPCSNLK